MPITNQKTYFKNLTALRGIAALMVIVYHIEQYKRFFNAPNLSLYKTFIELGVNGVVIFFVLSGFLITYILLQEKEATHTIAIKQFYLRRVLRIWPVYFLLIALSLFVLPYLSVFNSPETNLENLNYKIGFKILLYVFLLPNVVFAGFAPIPFASPTWSIGVEEQFYLVWPLLIKKTKKLKIVIVVLLVVLLALKLMLLMLQQNNSFEFYKRLIIASPFECLLIGSLLAILMFSNSITAIKLKYWLSTKTIQVIALVLLFFYIFMGFNIGICNKELLSVIIGIVIFNLAKNKTSIISLENKPLNFLGTISYGMYMYHSIAIVLAVKALLYFNLQLTYWLYPSTILGTVFFAWLSHRFMEQPFLRLKKRM